MTIALLFPGQGSQFIGMGKDFYNRYDSAKSVYNALDLALNRPLSDLIFNGSDEDILFCGMSIGYKDPDAIINSLASERRPIDTWATFL